MRRCRYAQANQTATDAFSSIRVIQAYGLQRTITQLYSQLMAPADAQMQKNAHYTGLAFGYSNLIMFGGWRPQPSAASASSCQMITGAGADLGSPAAR